MRIGEIAKQTGLNISNIRFYERKGLLCPEREDDSKYRDYTEEDVLRVKKILLYRKMGISIETIFLLLNNQANHEDVLIRQKDVLQDEIKNLQGAVALCEMILDKGCLNLSGDQLDQYLNYVYQEEEKGVRFAEVAELLEDITDFTREGVFSWSPISLCLHQHSWVPVAFSIIFWGIVIMLPVSHLIEVCRGQRSLSVPLLLMYGCIIAVYGYGFVKFRESKRRYDQEQSDREAGVKE